MKIGHKIRKIREFKNIKPKEMADRLQLSQAVYAQIEREEADISIERLLEVAEIFEMKPEDLLTFDEKHVFHNHGELKGAIGINYGVFNAFPEEMKTLYEKQIKLLEEQNQFLKEQNQFFHERLRHWEGK